MDFIFFGLLLGFLDILKIGMRNSLLKELLKNLIGCIKINKETNSDKLLLGLIFFH